MCCLNLNSIACPWRTLTDDNDVLIWVSAYSVHQLFWLKPFIFLHLTRTVTSERRKRRKIQQLGCEKRFFGLISPQPESLCLNCWRSEVHRYLGREPGGEKQSHHIPHNVTAVWCALGIFKSEVLQTGIKCANFISAEVVNSAHSESITDTIFAFGWGKLHPH